MKRADARMLRMAADGEPPGEPLVDFLPRDRLGLTCVGTDVRAPELLAAMVAQAQIVTMFLHMRACPHGDVGVVTCDAPMALQGLSATFFWLGYEFGREADQ